MPAHSLEEYGDFLNVEDVAEVFDRHPNTVRAWIKAGRLPVLRNLGRQHLVPKKALEKLEAEALEQVAS